MLKNNIKFEQHINHILVLVALEKTYISCIISDKGIQIVALVWIYKFLALSFII